ncbi:MAG TPA: aconitate hydratase AcnA [Alphaproteobacteria bacterium]
MTNIGQDTLKTRKTLNVKGREIAYYAIKEAEKEIGSVKTLPKSLKVLLENLLRFEDGRTVTTNDITAMGAWLKDKTSLQEIAYRPARVLMQDFTGVPAVVDLAVMREGIKTLGGKPQDVNPLVPVDLVIDHSVMVDAFGSDKAFAINVDLEFERNDERYEFLKWGQKAFRNFRVVPPGTGICHQVNLEYLAKTVWTSNDKNGATIAYPDTLVGTDSHTTMVNGMSVLGWGVGGIEAEAAMLGQPVSMVIPDVIGFKLFGRLPEGSTATDLVLTVTQMLRKKGVVNKFVEFYGDGLDHLTLEDRGTIANMAPEYGATCGFFPIDNETLRYLSFTGREQAEVDLVEAYAKEQGLWREPGEEIVFTDTLELNLADVLPSLAGPKRPQDRVLLKEAASSFIKHLSEEQGSENPSNPTRVEGTDYSIDHGDIVIAAITSCTNTSNPFLMLAAGLVARKALAKGLTRKPWVKTSLAPGSQVATDYFKAAGLDKDLDALGFNLVGYGCTTCIGNSGPLPDAEGKAVDAGKLNVAAVLSGNRNFEGRISQQVKSNYLASPPLVVAYAIAGTMKKDITTEPLGHDKDGNPVFLKDIWPTNAEVREMMSKFLTPDMFRKRYADVFLGPKQWQDIKVTGSEIYEWQEDSTYIRNPPFFDHLSPDNKPIADIADARVLAVLGDSITTDHISPAGSIKKDSPAGRYLIEHGVEPVMFNSYGARRGNYEAMVRGTFANIRIKNEMLDGVEGGYTKYVPANEQMSIYDAAIKYMSFGTPLVIFGGKEYGTGSSRDWAAKGTYLLGVKAVIAESFERIHRSNLIGMGVLPLEFMNGESRQTLQIRGDEIISISGLADDLKPRKELELTIQSADGTKAVTKVVARIDTLDELEYLKAGGILHYVLKGMAKAA